VVLGRRRGFTAAGPRRRAERRSQGGDATVLNAVELGLTVPLPLPARVRESLRGFCACFGARHREFIGIGEEAFWIEKRPSATKNCQHAYLVEMLMNDRGGVPVVGHVADRVSSN